LFASLRTYHAVALASDIAEYEILQKLNEKSPYMKFLPSIGIVSDFDGKPRPTLSFSLNKVYEVKNQREKENLTLKAKIEAAKLKNAQNFKNDSLELISTLKTLEIAQNALEALKATKTLENRILTVNRERFAAKTINETELLNFEREYLDFEQRERELAEKVELLKIEALKRSKT
jgi:hypothetical protein